MTTPSHTAPRSRDYHDRMTAALGAIDAQLSRPAVRKTPEQRAADFRAHNVNAARRLLTDLRDHRRWLAAHRRMNPCGPSLGAFYRDHLPDRVARSLAEVARLRRLAAGAHA